MTMIYSEWSNVMIRWQTFIVKIVTNSPSQNPLTSNKNPTNKNQIVIQRMRSLAPPCESVLVEFERAL